MTRGGVVARRAPRTTTDTIAIRREQMSEGMNRVMLLGNLGADPELRYTPAGQAVLNIRLATNETFLDRNKVHQSRTEWHSVVVWGARAEALARILGKGMCLLIEGWLRTSSYEKDGVKRYRTEVVAKEVCFTSRRSTPAMTGDEQQSSMDDPGMLEGATGGEQDLLPMPRAASAGPAGPRPLARNGRAAPRGEMDPATDELPF
jgi:single-strand DNA-binding protein